MKFNWNMVTILTMLLALSLTLWSSTPWQALAHAQAQTKSESESVVWLQAQEVAPAQSQLATQTLNPTHDATVNVTSPDAPNSGANLGVQGQNLGDSCNSSIESYLQVDLSSLSGSITAGSLSLRSNFVSSGSMTMSLFGGTNDSWDEASVTWNTKPSLDKSTTLASATMAAVDSDVVFSSSAALVAFLETQRHGDGMATFGIVATACDSASVTQSMSSKEGPVAPRLEITGADAPGVDLSSDMAMTETANSVVKYMVTITNNGNAPDTFDLSQQGASWSATISPTNVTLAAGASRTVEVQVDIPSSAQSGDSDTVTLTATSQSDNTISDTTRLTTTVTAPGTLSLADFNEQTTSPWRPAGLVLLVTLIAGAGLFVLRKRQ